MLQVENPGNKMFTLEKTIAAGELSQVTESTIAEVMCHIQEGQTVFLDGKDPVDTSDDDDD